MNKCKCEYEGYVCQECAQKILDKRMPHLKRIIFKNAILDTTKEFVLPDMPDQFLRGEPKILIGK